MITHCEALGVRDAKCPKNVNVLSMRAHEVPEMRPSDGRGKRVAPQEMYPFLSSLLFYPDGKGVLKSKSDT